MATVTLRPNSDVAKSNVSAYSSGTTAWNLVDEATLDPSDYFENKTTPGYCYMGFPASGIPAGSIISKITINWVGTNSAPAFAFSLGIRNPSTGTQYDSATFAGTTVAQNATSAAIPATRRPWDNAKWTVADIDALQLGVIAPTSLPKIQTRQFWVVVTYTAPNTVSSSKTLDAIIKAPHVGSFALDAVIFDGVRFFNLDSVLKRGMSGSGTLDSILRVERSGSATLDAYIANQVTGSFTLDAIQRVTQDGAEVDDSFARTVSGGWGDDYEPWDSSMLSNMSVNPTDGALYYEPEAVSSYAWRKFKIKKPKRRDRSILMQLAVKSTAGSVNVSYLTASVYMRHDDHLGTGLDYFQASFIALDVRLLSPNGFGDFSINQGAIQMGVRQGYDASDGAMIGPGIVTVPGLTWAPLTSDATSKFYIRYRVKGGSQTRIKAKIWKVGDPEPDWMLDFVATGVPTSSGWVMKGTGSRVGMYPTWAFKRTTLVYTDFEIDLDAVIKKTQTGTKTLDAVIEKTGLSGSFSLDAVLGPPNAGHTGTFALDAILRRGVSASLPLDAVLRSTPVRSFSVDAVLRGPRSATFPIDAVLRASRAGSATLDANIRKTVTGTTRLDAVVLAPRTAGVTLDSVILSPRTSTFSLAAAIVRRTQAAATLDAILRRGVVGTFALDATLRRQVTGSWDLDAVLRRTSTEHITLDSVVRGVASGTFHLDAIALRHQLGAFTLDSTITIVRSGEPVAVVEIGWIYATLDPHPIQAAIASEPTVAAIGSDPIVGILDEAGVIGAALGWSRQTGSFTLNAEIV